MAAAQGWSRRSDTMYWTAATAIAIVAGLIMSYHIGDAIQGFHAFNEGFYLSNGARDATRSFLAPIYSPLDSNNPFVYPMVLATALRVFGVTTAVGRAVSIAASMATVLLTFALAKRLYNERTGLVAAVLVAFTPGEMLAGRNIQIDPLMLALMVGASLAFVIAVKTQSRSWSVATGLLLGSGVLTKLPVLVLIPGFAVWELWRSHDFSWIRKKSTWVTATTFAILVAPWYAYRFLASSAFRGSQSYLAETGAWRGLSYLWQYVFGQIAWMFSPVLAALLVASLVYMVLKRQVADKFVISMSGTLLAVFFFYNYHVYYYLPLVPFGAIAAARGTVAAARGLSRAEAARTSRRSAAVLVTVTAVLAALLLGFSVATLSAKKYDGVPTDQYVPLLADRGYDPAKLVLGIGERKSGAEGAPITFYAQEAGVEVVAFPPPAGTTIPAGFRFVVLTTFTQNPASGAKFVAYPMGKVVVPVAFGRAFVFAGEDPSFFDLKKPLVARVGPWWRFGFQRIPGMTDPNYGLYEIPQ